jgi:hypothetical protein
MATADPLSGQYSTTSAYGNPTFHPSSQKKLALLTSSKSLGHASATIPPASYHYTNQASPLRDFDMTSYSSTTTIPPAAHFRTESHHKKLHKRTSSGNSLPASPSILAGPQSHFTHYDSSTPTSPSNSTPKIKPYLRKRPTAKDDQEQGRLDLSKSTLENGGALAGLGIHDFGGNRSASDVTFSHAGRRTPHMRTTSTGSQMSTASGTYRPGQPFVHPMRQTPTQQSRASSTNELSMNDDEARESSDIVTEDENFQLPNFRTRRSVSISSTPQNQPTPLSQSHTAEELGMVPKLTTSQTNLSMRSTKSSMSKHGRARGDTNRSDYFASASPSSRNSFDRAMSYVSGRSAEPKSQDDRISSLRQQFNEKEAKKDHKRDQEAVKKQERKRRKSEASERKAGNEENRRRRRDEHPSLQYYQSEPPNLSALPEQNRYEKTPRVREADQKPEGGWQKFVRMMTCSG